MTSAKTRRQARHRAYAQPGRAIFLGKEQRQGFVEPLDIYMLYCAPCGAFTETYPGGYGHVRCSRCSVTTARPRRKIRGEEAIVGYLLLTVMLMAFMYVIFTVAGHYGFVGTRGAAPKSGQHTEQRMFGSFARK